MPEARLWDLLQAQNGIVPRLARMRLSEPAIPLTGNQVGDSTEWVMEGLGW